MKKFILGLMLAFISIFTVSAQTQFNYAGSSRFTDNWSVTLQGGTLTTFDNFYSGHTATVPIVVVGLDKYVTPWLGFGVEGRTLIGTGHGMYNTHTAFDAVNVSGYGKLNLVNLFAFNGTRRVFEPVLYTGMGWGHQTAVQSNYATWRSGAELNFNVGKERAWAIVVNPSVVWGNPTTSYWATKLNKYNGMFEVTAGVAYHFGNSNHKHNFTKPVLYDYDEVAALKARIVDLQKALAKKPEKVTVNHTVTVTDVVANTYKLLFNQGSAELNGSVADIANALNKTSGNIVVTGYASPEGSEKLNAELAQARAEAVKKALEAAGVDPARIIAVSDYEDQRAAVITLQ